jgi:tetratricopeptide (TPR) repeat protein
MDDHANDLRMSLAEIEARATDAENIAKKAAARANAADQVILEAHRVADAAKTKTTDFLRELDEAKQQLQRYLDRSTSSPAPVDNPDRVGPASIDEQALSGAQQTVLIKAAQMLRETPEVDYSAEDWANRAYAAAAERDFESSATYFRNAAQASDAKPIDAAGYGVNRGLTLVELSRWDEAITAFNGVVERHETNTNPGVRLQVARALVNKAIALKQLSRYDEAIATWEDVSTRYRGDPDVRVREQVARLAVNTTALLLEIESAERAAELAEVALDILRPNEDRFPQLVMMSQSNKAQALALTARVDESLALLDDVIARSAGAGWVHLQDLLVEVALIRAITLAKVDRDAEAMAALQAIVTQNRSSSNASVRECVEKARECLTTPASSWAYPMIGWTWAD